MIKKQISSNKIQYVYYAETNRKILVANLVPGIIPGGRQHLCERWCISSLARGPVSTPRRHGRHGAGRSVCERATWSRDRLCILQLKQHVVNSILGNCELVGCESLESMHN